MKTDDKKIDLISKLWDDAGYDFGGSYSVDEDEDFLEYHFIIMNSKNEITVIKTSYIECVICGNGSLTPNEIKSVAETYKIIEDK